MFISEALTMTICFKGNSFKYETEAIMKLFLPVDNFRFVYDDVVTDGDFALISVKEENEFFRLEVSVSLDGKKAVMKDSIAKENGFSSCEFSLCRMLYKCLYKITGKAQPWGCITGIRPVKEVNRLIEKNMSREEIFSAMKEKYFISDEKLNLAYKTAVTQEKLLKIPKKSYSLYVSIPFCPTRCAYCSFVSHSMDSAQKLIPQYVEKLCKEIEITAEYAEKAGLTLDTVYFGGGTPTSLDSEDIDKIMKTVAKCFTLSTIREYTVEAGRADTITAEKLVVIKENGGNRISVNPQTMNDSVLKTIGRNHTAEQVREAFSLARKIGFENINTDLIAGLPSDSLDSFKNTVEEVLKLNPESITVHTLTLKRASSLFANAKQVSDDDVAAMVAYSVDRLCKIGYNPYYLYRQKNTLCNLENVGYAKEGKESLYNIFIMEEAQTILAVGAAASTKLCDAKSGKIERVYNYKFPYEYINRFDALMQRKNEIAEFYKKYPIE